MVKCVRPRHIYACAYDDGGDGGGRASVLMMELCLYVPEWKCAKRCVTGVRGKVAGMVHAFNINIGHNSEHTQHTARIVMVF